MAEKEEKVVRRVFFIELRIHICARMLHWKAYFVKLYIYVLYYHPIERKQVWL